MLDRKTLAKFGPPGFSLGQKEKDYVQHWLLSYLSRAGFAGVFKGGTCLQKAYQLPRYSEDLDFTNANEKTDAMDTDKISAFLSSAGFGTSQWKTSETEISKTFTLRYQGPLYMGKPVSEGTVRIELSFREKTSLEPMPTSIQPPYPDLLPYAVNTMNLTEIAAEKIRAVLTRQSARDLFDLYFLFRQDAIPDTQLINAKLKYYQKAYRPEEFTERINALSKIWKTEISALTPQPMDYAETARFVLDKAPK